MMEGQGPDLENVGELSNRYYRWEDKFESDEKSSLL